MQSQRLTDLPKLHRVSTFKKPSVTVSLRTLDIEQRAESKEKAIRLLCRAMVRLYLEENRNHENGKGLGVL
jgi:hypothetical protein